MAGYPREVIAQVLASVNITDVIRQYVDLQHTSGHRHKGLCPFHQEKTPSFTVDTQRQAFKCFGCGKGGDAITFLMEHEGMPFMDALEALADRGSVTLPKLRNEDSGADAERRKLYELGSFALRFYRDWLEHPMRGSQARSYLKTRDLKKETEKRFGLGFAPDGFDHFWKAAVDEGYTERLVEASGLARRSERGKLYDFFRNRLMIPIRDVNGKVIAFGGRDLSGDAPGKYINTPENAAYKKSYVLYGLHEARDAMRSEERALVVEGYFDVIRLADAGIDNAVATCGTSLTQGQARLLRRYVPEVVVVYDGDSAGVQAALRGVGVLVAEGLSVRILSLPDGLDPDDFIGNHGTEAFRKMIDDAPDFVRFYIQANEDRLGNVESRTAVAKELLTILSGIDEVLRRNEYIKIAAKALGVDEWSLRREFEQGEQDRRTRAQASLTRPDNVITFRPPKGHETDVPFVAALLEHGELLAHARESLEGLPMGEGSLTEVLEQLFAGVGPDLLQRLESDQARLLYTDASMADPQKLEAARDIVNKRINSVCRGVLDKEDSRLREAIRAAERAGDLDQARALMQEHMELRRKCDAAGAV